jgi:DNA adenine methylase
VTTKPFVKWAGGKGQLLPDLRRHLPETFAGAGPDFGRYFEPFVGAGAFFFHLYQEAYLENGATLGDMNPHLINAYEVVRDDVDDLIGQLRMAKEAHSEEFYYKTRAEFGEGNSLLRAAQFIYLLKTCFNGLWRVNGKTGAYNVPMGAYKNPGICDEETLRACSQALQGVNLLTSDFSVTVERAERGDFVYFDPPYVPVSADSNFTSYTADGFGMLQQVQLRDCALALKARGVHVLLSNADHPDVRALYRYKDFGFEMERIEARRSINSKSEKRGKVGELLIW